jgi:hypothetical protein
VRGTEDSAPLNEPTAVRAALAMTMDGLVMDVSSDMFVFRKKLSKTAAGVKQDKPRQIVLWLQGPVFRQFAFVQCTKRLSPAFICAYIRGWEEQK